MFIAHGAWLRKYARWILAGVLILLIPGFVALFTTTGGSRRRESDLPTLRGKPINVAEFQKARNSLMALHLMSAGKTPTRTAQFEDELTQEAVVRVVLLKKASEMSIRVGDDELIQQIRNQPMFLSENKQFDPEKYRRIIISLNTRGVSESQFEETMREEITLAHLRALIGSGAKVTPTELQLAYKPLHEKVAIELVQLDAAEQKEPITVTDDEVKTFFEQNKEAFRTPALAKVRYVFFPIADAKNSVKLTDQEIADYYERNQDRYTDTNNVAKPLDAVKAEIGEELLTARAARETADRATAMTTNLVFEADAPRPDFAKVAAQFAVTVHETSYFGVRDPVSGIEAGLQFNQEAFALDPKERPFSDPVTGKDGYYVLEYLDSKPSQIPPLEQVKDKVIDTLQQQRAHEATIRRGKDTAAQVKQALAAGKSFADACAELKLKPTSPEPFSLSDKTDMPAALAIKQTVLSMATNTVSDFIPTETGGAFFYLKQRLPPDPALLDKDKAELTAQVLERNRQALFQDWINSVLVDEQVNFGPRRSRPQPVEQPGEEAPAEPETPAEPAPAPAPAPSSG
jgi:peptidyl-prolyl cis-trans isomerase D